MENQQIYQVGEPFPNITLPSSHGNVDLHQYLGSKVLLYFYPKDMTPTCTEQACILRDNYAELSELNVVVIGISPDSLQSHEKFANKYKIPFTLLSDEQNYVSEHLGVRRMKKLYGREYMGIVRTTFLIDEKGILIRVWDNVRLKGHLEEVIAAIYAAEY
jgi:peroxiredoxin Q/BCP